MSKAIDPATLPDPEQLTTDDGAFRAAWRYASTSMEGVTYDVSLSPEGWWACECWRWSKDDTCPHVLGVRLFLVRSRLRDERQAELDARLGCRHPLTFDEDEPDFVEQRTHVYRTCMGCGLSVDRAPWQERIEQDVRARHALPSSPWSASERSQDADL